MPAEFVIPCDYARDGCQDTECEHNATMQALGDVARDFAVNIVEGSYDRHVCYDMFGHERMRPHDLVNACDFEVEAIANSISGAVQRLWTSNDYQDLIQKYDQVDNSHQRGLLGNNAARWQSMMDTNEATDQCVLDYGYRLVKRTPRGGSNSSPQSSVSIEYNAYCACMKILTKCEPRQGDLLLGICPRGATIHIPFLSGGVIGDEETPLTQTKSESKQPISIFGEQPFSKECHAYILFDTRGNETEVQIELGEHCPRAWLRDDDHGCHQFSPRCYGVRAKHTSVACCIWRYCNDPDDPLDPDCLNKTATEGQSASGLMGAITTYLIDPDNPTMLPPKLVNKIGYCAYHSNKSHSFVESHDEPPDYCYTFVDVKWQRFVDIATGWNFNPSFGEGFRFATDKNCTVIHGTARQYCPSIINCTDELGFEALVGSCPPFNETDMTHTVVPMPQCYEGVLPYSENGTYDTDKLNKSSSWNVLCYVHTFTDNSTGMKYRKYGFNDPVDEHYARHRGMNCFWLNCTEDESFCCCRTSKVPGKVCNDPNTDLWAEFRVILEERRIKSERRDPEGIPLNDEEFEECEGKQPSTHSPHARVAGFVGHGMCFFRQLPHELAHTDEDPEKRTIREFYEPSMAAPHPLAAAVCNRERWTLRDWLDGCACQLFRRPDDRVWEQYCCCIATKTDTVRKAIWEIRSRNQLRTLGDFLEE
ncbi:hypothetical protein AAVH_07113 [Aphelenchoides avenae]|nr:hypothetical protein AAVH_07113 [Aphelenchus avenae]